MKCWRRLSKSSQRRIRSFRLYFGIVKVKYLQVCQLLMWGMRCYRAYPLTKLFSQKFVRRLVRAWLDLISCWQRTNWLPSYQPNCWKMKTLFERCAVSWWSRTGLERYELVQILFLCHFLSRVNWENHAWFVSRMVTIPSVFTAPTFPFLKKCQTCLLMSVPFLTCWLVCSSTMTLGSRLLSLTTKNSMVRINHWWMLK